MKLTFLGTSAGKPTKERGLSALGVEFEQDNRWYLFDCGEATQFQLLYAKLSVGKLHSIFITHLHGDHFYGLPGLLSSKKMDGALQPLTLYGPKGIKKFIDVIQELNGGDFGYELTVVEYELNQEFTFDKFTLKVLAVEHSVDSVAFYIKENDTTNRVDEQKLREIGLEPSYLYGELKKGKTITHNGIKINPKEYMLEPKKGKRVIISGDNTTPEILDKYLDNLDLLIHECTYTQDVYDNLKKKFLHTTARDLAIACQKHSVKNLIATHISPRYHKDSKLTIDAVEEELRSYYDGEFFIADDFDLFTLSANSKSSSHTQLQKLQSRQKTL